MSHTHSVETTVWIPDPLFHTAEVVAARLGVSRDELYARALGSFVRKQFDLEVTERLDEVYSDSTSELAPALARLQSSSIARDEW